MVNIRQELKIVITSHGAKSEVFKLHFNLKLYFSQINILVPIQVGWEGHGRGPRPYRWDGMGGEGQADVDKVLDLSPCTAVQALYEKRVPHVLVRVVWIYLFKKFDKTL